MTHECTYCGHVWREPGEPLNALTKKIVCGDCEDRIDSHEDKEDANDQDHRTVPR